MTFQEYIPSEDPILIEIPRDFNSDGVKYDYVLMLKKIPYGQAEAARLWYEKLLNGLLYRSFVGIKVDPCLFMSKTFICLVYVVVVVVVFLVTRSFSVTKL